MKKLYPILLLLCFGCSKPERTIIKIDLVNNHRTLKIGGVDSVILNDIARSDSLVWLVLFQVYKMPKDTDMKSYQDVQPGSYLLKKGEVYFTPDTLFKRGQTYFLRYYDNAVGRDVWDYLKNNNHKGAPPYADYIFTP